jgi:hypothetical protein
MAGVQAAVLSVVCVMVPAVAAFTATSAATVNNGVSWLDAARGAADLWLLGHWGSLTVVTGQSTAVVSVAPLGIGLVSVMCCRFLARVSSARGWWLVGFGTLGYVGVSALIVFGATTGAARPSAPVGLCGAAFLAIVGLIWGNAAARGPARGRRTRGASSSTGGDLVPPPVRDWCLATVPPWLRAVPRTAVVTAGTMLAGAALMVVIWVVTGWDRFGEMTALLDAGMIGGFVLVLVNIAFVPNLLLYAMAYLSGIGFMVGSGTAFSPRGTVSGPLPALGILGFLPADPPSIAVWLVAVPVAAGGLAGLRLRRRLAASTPWWTMAAGAALSAVAAAGVVALAGAAASGGAGPGRMAEIGVDARAVFIALSLECAAGAVVVAILARARIADRVYSATHPERPIRVKGRGAVEPSA